MATVRYIGPSVVVDGVEHGRVKVPVLDREMDPGEVVEVPDELLEQFAWPETLWEITATEQAPKKATKKPSDTTGSGE